MYEVGVLDGRVCPECGQEDSVPIVHGLPNQSLFEEAERGLVWLAGCIVREDMPAFYCRGCSLKWGTADDPTTDEQHLADLLGVRYSDVVAAVGTGWRTVSSMDVSPWFISGRPGQVGLAVRGMWVVLAPVRRIDGRDAVDDELSGSHRRFSRDDLLTSPELLAQAADEIARARRRSFRWCPTCRLAHPPEQFSGYRGVCTDCAVRHHGIDA